MFLTKASYMRILRIACIVLPNQALQTFLIQEEYTRKFTELPYSLHATKAPGKRAIQISKHDPDKAMVDIRLMTKKYL
jgi:hypothetical protein